MVKNLLFVMTYARSRCMRLGLFGRYKLACRADGLDIKQPKRSSTANKMYN